jgi:two-component system, chemotaxis family, sensor kinase CheA
MIKADPAAKVEKFDPRPSRGLTIRAKLLLFIIAACCLILAALATTAFFLSAVSLRQTRAEGFQTLRRSLSRAVNTFMDQNRRDIATQSEQQTLRDALAELSAGYDHLREDLEAGGFKADDLFLAEIRNQLREEYGKTLLAALKTLGRPPETFDSFAELSPQGLILQYVYILRNPAPLGSKYLNNLSSDIANNVNLPTDFRIAFSKTRYARAMDRYQASCETIVRRSRYGDLILIDNEGNVVYSFNKGWDFGTNIFRGWQEQAQLKSVFLGARYVPLPEAGHASVDHVMVSDLARYPAAYDAPVLFMGCAIANRLGGRVGVLVYEIPSKQFTDIVSFDQHWEDVGLGTTGEAYIVGPDRKLRTESRFLNKLPPEMKSQTFDRTGTPGPPTSILSFPLRNAAVEQIFSADDLTNEGQITFYDELGHESIGVFAPLSIPDLDWGLVVRIGTAEAFAPAAHLTFLIAIGGLTILAAAIGATLLFAHFLSRPIMQLVATAEAIGSGDPTARAPISSSDEIGFLARRFNNMIDQVQGRNRQVRKILETVNEGLFLLGPDLVIQPECSRATEEIFQRKIEGLSFLDLLKPHPGPGLQPILSDEVLDASKHYLELLLNPRIKEKLVQQTNPLIGVEFQSRLEGGRIRSKFLEFRFNRVIEAGGTTQIMVTVLDSTSRISLSRQIQENEAKAKSQIEMLFGVMHVDPLILSEFLDHAEAEIAETLRLLEVEQSGSRQPESESQRSTRYGRLLQKISRSIHLVKGNAAMLRLSYFEDLAHQLEEKIAAVRTNSLVSGEDFVPITTGMASLLDQVGMTRDLIQRLSAMQEVFGKGQKRPGLGDFAPLVDLARDIASRNAKQVRVTLEIASDLVRLPEHLREPVQTMMTQLIRNAVIHGIELPSERLARKKQPTGAIRISANRAADRMLALAVRDDGRGISYEQLRQRAVELGYANLREIREWNHQQLIDLLYQTGFTTLDRPALDGGLGVGLDAVKDLAARYGGLLRVSSREGSYCEFRIELPC